MHPNLGAELIKEAFELPEELKAAILPALVGAGIGGIMGYAGDQTSPLQYSLLGALVGGSAGMGLHTLAKNIGMVGPSRIWTRFINPASLGAAATLATPVGRLSEDYRRISGGLRSMRNRLGTEADFLERFGEPGVTIGEAEAANLRKTVSRLRSLEGTINALEPELSLGQRVWRSLGQSNARRYGRIALLVSLLAATPTLGKKVMDFIIDNML